VAALLLYDADCAFCSRAAAYSARLGLHLTIASIHTTDLDSLGVSPSRAMREMPFVGADGVVVYGHAAVAAALATGAAPLRLLGRLMVFGLFSRLFARLYRWVAAHRHQLPGGNAACAMPARDI
jgi:predicted DCC family thiol-disulfide oxidoreductase YuxK